MYADFEYEEVFEDQPLSPEAKPAQHTKALMEVIQTKVEGIRVQMHYLYWLLSSHLCRTISLSSMTQEKHAGPNLTPTRGFTISPTSKRSHWQASMLTGTRSRRLHGCTSISKCCRTWFRETHAVNICLLIS